MKYETKLQAFKQFAEDYTSIRTSGNPVSVFGQTAERCYNRNMPIVRTELKQGTL